LKYIVELENALSKDKYILSETILRQASNRNHELDQNIFMNNKLHMSKDTNLQMCHFCHELHLIAHLKPCKYNSRRKVPESLEEGDCLLVSRIFESNNASNETGLLKYFLRIYINANPFRNNLQYNRCFYKC
jgi:hypothetical protein